MMLLRRIAVWVVLGALAILGGCGSDDSDTRPGSPGERDGQRWALAVHGGAGVPHGSLSEERQRAYRGSLEAALRSGVAILERGGRSLDAVEQIIRQLEDDPLFNAGKGAVFSNAGINELDASIMDGSTLACGGVAGVTTVKNPISLARLVMERTPHVLLARDGAEQFAQAMDLERVDPAYFFTQDRWDSLERVKNAAEKRSGGGTVGAVALDRHGNLAAGTSTGGLTNKMYGRVGDSPIIGAGTYADNTTCAVSATGQGEEFIRHGVARSIAALMELTDLSLQEAADKVVHQRLQPDDGGIIAVDGRGNIAMPFNTAGMFRAAADSDGRFEVAIW
jgi:beta-aspartyl-peptidase (threonine type)